MLVNCLLESRSWHLTRGLQEMQLRKADMTGLFKEVHGPSSAEYFQLVHILLEGAELEELEKSVSFFLLFSAWKLLANEEGSSRSEC